MSSRRQKKRSGGRGERENLDSAAAAPTPTAPTFYIDESSRASEIDGVNENVGLNPGADEKMMLIDAADVVKGISFSDASGMSGPGTPVDTGGRRFGTGLEQSPVAHEGAVVPTIFPDDDSRELRDAQVVAYLWRKVDGENRCVGRRIAVLF